MGDTPSWAQLHELEPGLRPDNGLVLEHGEWTLNPYYKEAGIDDEIAYSLCRDRATDVLGSLGCYVSPEGASGWAVWKRDGDDTYAKVEGLRPTRDEALRAACAAVIGAK